MNRTTKELAFLRNLYVSSDWTERFTRLVDKHLTFEDRDEILYVNSGAGNHALALRDRLDDETKISCVCDDVELMKLAQAKSLALKSYIRFYEKLPREKFPTVIANASLVPPLEIERFVNSIVKASSKRVAFFLPTAGSFGEIFSFLWEVLSELNLLKHSGEIERLISELPTTSKMEKLLRNAKLKKVESKTSNEIYEYKSGEEFLSSVLVSEFLLPRWIGFLSDKKKEQVVSRLARDTSAEHEDLSFRFSVKATLVVGQIS